jgi:CelD/BcsL family acetyltransferase involved in cellulose biosynthesis
LTSDIWGVLQNNLEVKHIKKKRKKKQTKTLGRLGSKSYTFKPSTQEAEAVL